MPQTDYSTETILTFDNRDLQSEWSAVWSTTNVAIMGAGQAQLEAKRARARRRLRFGALTLSAMLTMHCRISASALTGGLLYFMSLLAIAVIFLGNPMRHFEVFLGQWSISGPGRAFRIIPMFDGIGLAMCINAIIRAIQCCVMAAIATIYLIHSVSNNELPFTHCRHFNLTPYEPETHYIIHSDYNPHVAIEHEKEKDSLRRLNRLKNYTNEQIMQLTLFSPKTHSHKVKQCKETYPGPYPPLYRTPAYNFFFVEVVQYGEGGGYNIKLGFTIIAAWAIIWAIMVGEKTIYKKLIWNNLAPMMLVLPGCWSLLFIFNTAANFTPSTIHYHTYFADGSKDTIATLGDALQVALYIHSSSIGTELIHGKALNNYAQGHIDPLLNGENIWHSVIVFVLAGLHSLGATLCSFIDPAYYNTKISNIEESVLWTIPLYSTCTALGNYSHFVSSSIFGGLAISYGTVAYVFLKSAIHTILEYKITLIYMQQTLVFGLVVFCMGSSLLYATYAGAAIIESIDTLITGVAMPFVCVFEVLGLIYIYRSTDFISDINVANEENQTGVRIAYLWKLLPVMITVTLIIKCTTIAKTEIPPKFMYFGLGVFIAVILAIPLRAAYNYYVFMRK